MTTYKTTLSILARNFHQIMFGGMISGKPLAECFTVDGSISGYKYWEILDIREDGKYPCCILGTPSTLNIDMDRVVALHFCQPNEEVEALLAEERRKDVELEIDSLQHRISQHEKAIKPLVEQMGVLQNKLQKLKDEKENYGNHAD